MKTDSSSTISNLKRQFNEIQNNLHKIEQNQASFFNHGPGSYLQSSFDKAPVRQVSHRPPSDFRYYKGTSSENYKPALKSNDRDPQSLSDQLDMVTAERDRLSIECKELKATLDNRNRLINELRRENQDLKAQFSNERCYTEDKGMRDYGPAKTPNVARSLSCKPLETEPEYYMEYLPFNAYSPKDFKLEQRGAVHKVEEKRNNYQQYSHERSRSLVGSYFNR